jgi:hypothetical protein
MAGPLISDVTMAMKTVQFDAALGQWYDAACGLCHQARLQAGDCRWPVTASGA